MNKIFLILCSATILSLLTIGGYSQKKNDSLKVLVKGDTLWKNMTADTIKKELRLDSIQTLEILKKLVEKDSARQKLKTDTLKKKIVLDSLQTRKLLEKILTNTKKLKKKTKKDIEYEVDGLIIPNTISRAGRDFYDIFFSKWEAPKGVKNFIIEINEKPHPQMGTEISILVKETEIFKERVQPKYDIIEQYARYAVYLTYKHLSNLKNQELELEGGDLSGSGIF